MLCFFPEMQMEVSQLPDLTDCCLATLEISPQNVPSLHTCGDLVITHVVGFEKPAAPSTLTGQALVHVDKRTTASLLKKETPGGLLALRRTRGEKS